MFAKAKPGDVLRLRESVRRESIATFEDGTAMVFTEPATYSEVCRKDGGDVPTRNLLVSALVGRYMREAGEGRYSNIWGPDTGPGGVVRDSEGAMKGVRRMIRYC